MKLKYLLSIFFVGAIVLSILSIVLALKLNDSLGKVRYAIEKRFASISLAREMQESSDDLTKFARAYAQTESKEFKDYFNQVLAMRNGEQVRPHNYNSIYWDLLIGGEKFIPPPLEEKAISFYDRMLALNFSDEEFRLLDVSKTRSDNLAKIENLAFKMIENKKLKGKNSALDLLYGEEYYRTKATIMSPIRQFIESVNARTGMELKVVQLEASKILYGSLMTAMALLGLLAIFLVIIYRKVIVRTSALESTAKTITKGDLSVRSEVSGNDELGLLGKTFNTMVSEMVSHLEMITTAKRRMEQELDVAKDIQMSLVPLTFPAYPEYEEFDLYAQLTPAREVGGDFYDFYFIDKDHLCITVGDVSGKGVPAALMMAVCRTLLKIRAKDDFSTASILTHVNDEMAKENPNCMFVTIFMGILNIRTGKLVFTNAGHNPSLLKTKDGEVKRITDLHGPVVAAIEGVAYKESVLELNEGDTLLAYTDGVTEAHNKKNELYSEERLLDYMKDHKISNSIKFVDDLYKSVRDFEEGNEPFDDVTCLCMRYLRSGEISVRSELVLIKNSLENIPQVLIDFEKFAALHELSEKMIMKMGIVFDDVLNNIIKYAYSDDKDHIISVFFELYSNTLRVTVKDDGMPFNPLKRKAPDIKLPLAQRNLGGLGIHLVKSLMDECHYKRKVDENVLTLVKSTTSGFSEISH